MHHIQKSIILNLARTSPLRFTELQPPRVPNNAFSYHLRKLIEAGYIESTANGYVATRKALKLVVFGASSNRPQPAPAIISMIYIENLHGEILLINRNHKPFQGWYGLPSGLIHQGETLVQAAQREMLEKTGLVAEGPLQSVGILDVRYVEEESQDIFVHSVAFVYRYVYSGDEQSLENKVNRYGQLSWSKLGRGNILAEVGAIRELINKKLFFQESLAFIEPSQLSTMASQAKPKAKAAGLAYR